MEFAVQFIPSDSEPTNAPTTIIVEQREIGIKILDQLRADNPDMNINAAGLPSTTPSMYIHEIDEITVDEEYARKTERFDNCNLLDVKIINGFDKIREHLKIGVIENDDRFSLYYELQESILRDWENAGFPTEWTIE